MAPKLVYVIVQQDGSGKIQHVELLDSAPQWQPKDIPEGFHETTLAGYINGGDSSVERELDGTWDGEFHD